MFEEFNGIPAHPMLVHSAVVFIPLLVLGAVVYALVPRLRSRIGWVVALLAVAAPVTTLFAKLSGDALRDRMVARETLPAGSDLLNRVDDHRDLGNITLWFTLALGVVTLVLVFLTGSRRAPAVPAWGTVAVSLIVVALAVASGYYVFWTGDYGAKAVWQGF